MKGEFFMNKLNIKFYDVSGNALEGFIEYDKLIVSSDPDPVSFDASCEVSSDGQIVNAFRQDLIDRVDIVIMCLIVMLSIRLIFNSIVGWK